MSCVTSTTVLNRRAKMMLEVALELMAGHRIERTERLVEQQHFRVEHQRPHQRHALPLPTRQLARKARKQLLGQVHQLRQLVDAPLDAGGFAPQVVSHQRDVVPSAEMREQTALLNEVTGPVTQLRNVGVRNRRAVKAHFTAVGLDQAQQQLEQRGLAAAARPQQHCGPPERELQ